MSGWGNFAAHIREDDLNMVAKARQELEDVGGEKYRPEILETYNDRRGKMETTLHGKVDGKGGLCEPEPEANLEPVPSNVEALDASEGKVSSEAPPTSKMSSATTGTVEGLSSKTEKLAGHPDEDSQGSESTVYVPGEEQEEGDGPVTNIYSFVKYGSKSSRSVTSSASSSTLNGSSGDGGISLLVDHWANPTPIPDRDPTISTSNFTAAQPTASSSASSTLATDVHTKPSTSTPPTKKISRVDYATLPRSEWFLWRRCCQSTCHTVYFAGGIYADRCYCGHEKCDECSWATDFGYPPFY